MDRVVTAHQTRQFNIAHVCMHVCVCAFNYLAGLEDLVSYYRWTPGQSYPVSLLLHQRTQEGGLQHEAKHTSTVHVYKDEIKGTVKEINLSADRHNQLLHMHKTITENCSIECNRIHSVLARFSTWESCANSLYCRLYERNRHREGGQFRYGLDPEVVS